MIRLALSLVFVLSLFACAQTEQSPALQTASDSPWLTGKRAYENICAGCHEEGIDGAPRTGDRAAWEGRSWLWEAVLFEHAKKGTDGMPARGGSENLDDATVAKAAEYMLTLTYPETHRN